MADAAEQVRDKGLSRRGGVWWGRVLVPVGLQERIGRRDIRRSLKTEVKAEAAVRLAEFRAAVLRWFARVERNEVSPSIPEDFLERPSPLSLGQVRAHLVAYVLAELDATDIKTATLTADERRGWDAAMDAEQDHVLGIHESDGSLGYPPTATAAEVAGFLARALAPRGLKLDDFAAADRGPVLAECRTHWGWLCDLKAESATDTARLMPRRLRYRESFEAGQAHGPGRAPATSAPPAPPPGTLTLAQAVAYWIAAERNRKPNTIQKVERAAKEFASFLKTTPESLRLATVTPEHAEGFRQALTDDTSRKSKTVADVMGWVQAVFKVAQRKERSLPDVFARVEAIRKVDAERGEPLTAEELRAVFGHPLFQRYELPGAPSDGSACSHGADAAYWVPVMALYTGARMSELCQLRTADVEAVPSEDEDGQPVPVIHIREAADDGQRSSLKNAASRRLVPVHPELARLGFLEYVEAVRNSGHALLFPRLLFAAGTSTVGSNFSRWFGRFTDREGMGLAAGKKLHALRHTAIDALDAAGVQRTHRFVIAGHTKADGAEGRTVGDNYTHARRHPSALAASMAKLRHRGLPALPRVYAAPGYPPLTAVQNEPPRAA